MGGSVLPGVSFHIACRGGALWPEGQQTWEGPAASHTTSGRSEGPRSLGRKGCWGLRDMRGQPTVGGGELFAPPEAPHPTLGPRP